MIKIKVCGMNNPLNVKNISDLRPDYMGFIFYTGSPRYIGENIDASLFCNIPAGITAVGIFVNEDSEKVISSAMNNGLNMIQLHGSESPGYCSRLRSSGLIIIKAFSISQYFEFEIVKPYMDCCDYFLFDSRSEKHGGTGIKFDWEIFSGYSLDKAFFLSGGVGPDDAGLIKTIWNRGLFAVDINSRFEIKPGIKNVNMVKTFMDTLKNDQI